ncbi:MAG: DUF1499 domain-containing protein [Hyphomicrobiales bacterium]|nr:DUF1499 domain-containing protein [Hyphomicrobiales bacterium]
MVYRPPPHRSRLASLSRMAGTFALPVLIIAIAGHRLGLMATGHAVAISIAAFGFAAVAFLAGLLAAAVIWRDGRLGARHAVVGLIYGLLGLAPLGWLGLQAATHPRLLDVTTDAVDPPLYRAAAFLRVGRFNSPTPPPPAERQRIRALTPEIGPRRYSVGSDLLYAVTLKRIEAAGWTLLASRPPTGDGDFGRIEAVAGSLVFGLPDDVVIRILPEPQGARIDMRNSPRWGEIDFGRGAARIRAFLDDLDAAVVETYGS